MDFWKTLFDYSGGEPRNAQCRTAMLDAIRRAGIDCDDVRFDDVYRGIWEYFDKHWLEQQRTPSSREMIDEMLRRLEFTLDDQALDAVASTFSHGVLEHPPELLPGAATALADLHAQ